MTARRKVRIHHQTGVTLIELILSMVIISIALVGILAVMNLTAAHSADPVVQHQAVAIAESYLEEITLQAYSGGVSSDRANFDDVDDYKTLPDTVVRDQQGNAVAGLSRYSVSVSVSSPMTLTDGVQGKQISVSVSGPGFSGLTLVGYKMDN